MRRPPSARCFFPRLTLIQLQERTMSVLRSCLLISVILTLSACDTRTSCRTPWQYCGSAGKPLKNRQCPRRLVNYSSNFSPSKRLPTRKTYILAGSSNGVSVDAVEVGECCSLPCYLTNGQNVSVTVVFTAGKSNLYFRTKISHLFSIPR